ncbi:MULTISPECIES: TetR/AcrR family transcriptional regulator [unclassified Janthinobacterium]|uniref:TetR/AcrR family transcriptional regulator n=1 Tax=unclassified Janthinobacterium TaxID=2610881 RepID=UPI0003454D61|nr:MULTISPECIES: TetR/AcrR family transcriptional regulator [unclassified Janthinobacterium]MEC5159641.1 TetR/AcrR family transcriptional repressor of lmrAB and yxaGH operons [Janthinobacterium sp. CG_S6]
MSTAALPRDEIVLRILAAFRQYGYEGASLGRLSSATGLGRSSLYHHFPKGKEDMANAAMSAVSAWFGEHVLATLAGEEPAARRLECFAAKLAEFYRQGESSCLTDVFTIGEAGAVFQQRIGERMKLLIGALAKTAQGAGVAPGEALRRAEDAVVSIQGSLIVARALGDTAPFLRAMQQLPRRLLGE